MAFAFTSHRWIPSHDQRSKVPTRCYNKTFHSLVILIVCLSAYPPPPGHGEVPLSLSLQHWFVGSQPAAEWMSLPHSMFGPLFPPRTSVWRAFCWQLLAPAQRHLSWTLTHHLFAPRLSRPSSQTRSCVRKQPSYLFTTGFTRDLKHQLSLIECKLTPRAVESLHIFLPSGRTWAIPLSRLRAKTSPYAKCPPWGLRVKWAPSFG